MSCCVRHRVRNPAEQYDIYGNYIGKLDFGDDDSRPRFPSYSCILGKDGRWYVFVALKHGDTHVCLGIFDTKEDALKAQVDHVVGRKSLPRRDSDNGNWPRGQRPHAVGLCGRARAPGQKSLPRRDSDHGKWPRGKRPDAVGWWEPVWPGTPHVHTLGT